MSESVRYNIAEHTNELRFWQGGALDGATEVLRAARHACSPQQTHGWQTHARGSTRSYSSIMPITILRNVGGVQGLHAVLDAFDEACEKQLFESEVHGGNQPQLPSRHGTHTNPTFWASHATEIFQACNVVKEGLVPDYITPDYLFAITYPAGCSGFQSHLDSRYKWGEFCRWRHSRPPEHLVLHAIRCRGPGGRCASRSGRCSGGAGGRSQRARQTHSSYLRHRAYTAASLDLRYERSSPRRLEARHPCRAFRYRPNEPAPPSWNPHKMRRALTLRATKVYSDHCLTELLKARPGDASIKARITAQNKYRPQRGDERMNDEELAAYKSETARRRHLPEAAVGATLRVAPPTLPPACGRRR